MALNPLVVADDLTGAAESAAAFLPRAVRIVDHLGVRESRDLSASADVLVVDTDSRYQPPDEAARRCRAALALRPSGTVIKKIDSTLRGSLAAEVATLRASTGPVIVAPALPALGRTVVGGILRLRGVVLSHTDAWASEDTPAPSTVAEAIGPLPVRAVGLAAVRAEPDVLAGCLAAAEDAGAVAVCDTETDDDLDRIVRAGRSIDCDARWVGSAGLAQALARAEPCAEPGVDPTGAATSWDGEAAAAAGPALFVVGTSSRAARAQVSRLAGRVAAVVPLDPAELLATAGERAATDVARRTAGRSAVVFITHDDGAPARRVPDVARALARAVAPAAAEHGALYLSGGETARAVLRALGTDCLHVRAGWEEGVIASTTPAGRPVVTKPGGFGDRDTLLRVADRLGVPESHKEDR